MKLNSAAFTAARVAYEDPATETHKDALAAAIEAYLAAMSIKTVEDLDTFIQKLPECPDCGKKLHPAGHCPGRVAA